MRLFLSHPRFRQFAPLLLVLVGASVAVGAYLQSLHFPFVLDDNGYITQNTRLTGLPLAELWRLLVEPYNSASEFLPLRELSYWFDFNLFGLNPSAFRLHNIILYVLCLPLVYFITSNIWQYFRPENADSAPWVAAIVAALFALHPSHAEAVVWIAGRKDVLSGFFSLLAIWLAISSRQEQGLSVRYAIATLFAFGAAILSKASSVAVAPVIALLWFLFWLNVPDSNKRYLTLLWPLSCLLMATLSAIIFATFTTQRLPLHFSIEVVTRAFAVLGGLARITVSPESRHFFYPVLEDPYLPFLVALGTAIIMTSVVCVVLAFHRRLSLEGFAIIVFFMLCLPSMQLVPYKPPSLISDRFIFLAVWPIVLLLVTFSWRLKPVLRGVLLFIIAIAWSYQTMDRTRDWRSMEAVIDVDVKTYPGFYMPLVYKILAVQLPLGLRSDAMETASNITLPEIRSLMIEMIKTDSAVHVAVTTGTPDGAMHLLDKVDDSVKQLPEQAKWNPVIHHVFGESLSALRGEWEYLVKQFPDDASVRYNAGLWMLGDRRYNNALVYLRTAIDSQRLPESMRGTAFKNLGLALLENGQVAEAEAPLRAALEQSPSDFRAYCLLIAVYKQTGRTEEAARAAAECRSHVQNEKSAR